MGIRESLLNTITSVGNSDFVRIVTSAGASSKATLQNVIKSFESGLGAKSSLTTSDYIRVVGSDNNLYKQSVSSVKTGMGISALETSVSNLNNVTGVTDLNDAIGNNRVYYFNSTASNKPSGLNYGYVFVMSEANGVNTQQIAVGRGGTDAGPIYRRGRNSSGTWGDWVKEPTKEIFHADSTGNLSYLVKEAGFYLLVAQDSQDTSAYYEGFAYKVNGANAVHTAIGSNKLTIGVQNANGTVVMYYNGTKSTTVTASVLKVL